MELEESFELLFENWDCENKGSILPLARKCVSINPSERQFLRALEVALSLCLRNFTIEELENEVFGFACPAARNVITEKLKHLEKNPTCCVESLGVCLKIISFFHDVFEYLSGMEKVSIVKVKTLLTITSDLLLSCFSHCKISNKVYGSLFTSFAENLSNFFKKCCSLQKQLFHFLTKQLECNIENDREILLLNLVITSLSKSGFVLITLEIKTMAEVWKTFVLLTERYLCCLKSSYNMGETINELCCSVTSNIDTVLYSENLDFYKIIKLSCFLLKLIIKFCELFMGYLKDCHTLLLNLLLKLYKWDVLIGNKSDQDLINQLTVGTEPLLSQLIMDEHFIRECSVVSQDSEKSAEFSILCCSILKKLLDSNGSVRHLWLNENKNILEWIFLTASSSQFIMCSNIYLPSILVNGKQKKFTDLYEYVLVITSAFLMTCNAEEYSLAEETLIKSILQTNPIRALLAIDMWCLLARFADSELCFSQIISLSKLFQEFHSGTFRVEKWHLASLIQRLFPLLTDTQKGTFLKSFQPPLYSSLWGGSKLDCFRPNEACDVCEGILAQVHHLTDGVKGPCSGQGITARREGVMHKKFGGKILKLWKFNCEDLSSIPQSVRFLKIACALTGCIVSEMPSVDLLMVLSQMKTLLTLGQPTCTKLYFTWVLNSLSAVRIPPGHLQKKIIVITADIFKNLLSSKEALVRQKALETFYYFAHRTSHGEVISMSVQNAPELRVEITNYLKKKPLDQGDFILSDYVNELSQLKFRHTCPKVELNETVMFKKIKLDTPDLQDVVMKWRETGEKILQLFHLLPDTQRIEIKSLCQSIITLLR